MYPCGCLETSCWLECPCFSNLFSLCRFSREQGELSTCRMEGSDKQGGKFEVCLIKMVGLQAESPKLLRQTSQRPTASEFTHAEHCWLFVRPAHQPCPVLCCSHGWLASQAWRSDRCVHPWQQGPSVLSLGCMRFALVATNPDWIFRLPFQIRTITTSNAEVEPWFFAFTVGGDGDGQPHTQ